MKKFTIILCLAALGLTLSRCRKAQEFPESGWDKRLSGGAATVFDESSRAFTKMVDGLSGVDARAHELGDRAFEQTFVAWPAPVNGGLGPIFNNVSCISCHHNDGKGTPTFGQVNSSMLFRMSAGAPDPFGGPAAVFGYGGQLQDAALQGVTPEGKVAISYNDVPVIYADGSTTTLRKPTYAVSNWYKGSLPAGCLLSPRMAPPVFGLGLLELIPKETIEAIADENDADGDGISGRPNYAYNAITKQTEIGRFGLKATVPSIELQVAGAYNQDMGVTSAVFPVESSFGQPQGDTKAHGVELPDSVLRTVIFYIKTLAVPARRNVDAQQVMDGEQLFTQMQCAACHRPQLQTGTDVRFPPLSNQRIQPFTDLLLHDMGEGLADGRPDYKATGNEWRTAPLWGIGLFVRTNGVGYYLHDGRARSLEEAILWHSGEAAKARENFRTATKAQRDALVAFLKSL